jgi:RHS repeat-associated protein
MGISDNQGVQPYKYTGKELDMEHGLVQYDFVARQHDPAIGRFMSIDPLCEKYYWISPYAYCANNPVNRIDPNGMDDYSVNLKGQIELIKRTEDEKDKLIALGKNDKIKYDDVENVISNYIKEHPQFNSFILQPTQEREQNENPLFIKHGFLLGPGYESILMEQQLKLYFNLSGKRIFYLSDINTLLKEDNNPWTIEDKPDSIILGDWIIKNSSALFIHRAIYLYYNESGTLEVNLRPDTIFAPRLLKNSIRFKNIKE